MLISFHSNYGYANAPYNNFCLHCESRVRHMTMQDLRIYMKWCSTKMIFNLFHYRIPRYIFFLTLNPKVLGAQFKLYIVYNLHLK